MEHPCSPPVAEDDPISRDRVLRGSLAHRSDYLLIGTSLVGGIALAVNVCTPVHPWLPYGVELGPHALPLALPLALLPLMLTLLFIGVLLTPWRFSLEQEWLRAIPFPFAHHGYLQALKNLARTNGLTLLLTFDHDPVQGDFDQLFKLRLPGAKARWLDDATVMVSSPPQLGGGGAFARGVYKNAPLHRWFRRAAAPFLTDLHQKGGLKKVTVRTG